MRIKNPVSVNPDSPPNSYVIFKPDFPVVRDMDLQIKTDTVY